MADVTGLDPVVRKDIQVQVLSRVPISFDSSMVEHLVYIQVIEVRFLFEVPNFIICSRGEIGSTHKTQNLGSTGRASSSLAGSTKNYAGKATVGWLQQTVNLFSKGVGGSIPSASTIISRCS